MVFGFFKSKPKKLLQKKVLPPQEVIEKLWNDVIDEFVNGDYGDDFDSNLLLKKDEKLIIDLPQIQLCEERTVKMKGGHKDFQSEL